MATKITNDNITSMDSGKLTGTVADSQIDGLNASKLTGSIADARIPASAVTQHVLPTDTTSIENDIAVLALQNAVNSNISAHGLQNSWIEQFEDSSAITGLSTAFRHDDEYIGAGSFLAGNWPYTNYADQVFSVFGSGWADVNGFNSSNTTHQVANNTASSGNYLGYASSPSGFNSGIQIDFLTATKWVGLDVGFNNTHGFVSTWRLESSDDGSNWSIVDQTGSTASATGETAAVPNNLTITTNATGLITNTTNPGNYSASGTHIHGGTITFGTPVTVRHLRIAVGSSISNGNANAGIDWIIPKINSSTVTATGSFTSTTITPQDSASKSSLGLVLLYKDNAGTNALNTDIVAQVSADNGSNYSTCVLASKGTFSTSVKIAIAPAIAVTAGTQLKYKISFANQASGSKQAHIHGVALQY